MIKECFGSKTNPEKSHLALSCDWKVPSRFCCTPEKLAILTYSWKRDSRKGLEIGAFCSSSILKAVRNRLICYWPSRSFAMRSRLSVMWAKEGDLFLSSNGYVLDFLNLRLLLQKRPIPLYLNWISLQLTCCSKFRIQSPSFELLSKDSNHLNRSQ